MKFRSWAKHFAGDRPLDFLSVVGGMRDFLLGLGFVLKLAQVEQTHLYMNYNALWLGVSGPAAGWIMMAVGLLIVFAALTHRIEWTRNGLKAQCLIWLFSALMYGLSHEIVLALVFGVFFSIPAAYLAFYYKFRKKLDTAPVDEVE